MSVVTKTGKHSDVPTASGPVYGPLTTGPTPQPVTWVEPYVEPPPGTLGGAAHVTPAAHGHGHRNKHE